MSKHIKAFFQDESFLSIRIFFLPLLILELLFLTYLRGNHYMSLQADVMLCLLLVGFLGVLLGGLILLLPSHLRFLPIGTLFVLFLDVQTNFFQGSEIELLHRWILAFAFFSLLAWAILRYVELLLLPFFLFLLITTPLFPPNPPPYLQDFQVKSRQTTANSRPSSTRSNRSIWIHLILDAHIGTGGFPKEIDPQKELASKIEQDYINQGMHIFPKAHSTFNFTNNSLRSLFTFSPNPKQSNRSYNVDPKKNLYFQELKKKGYRLHILQSSRVLLCKPTSLQTKKEQSLSTPICLTYRYLDLRALRSFPSLSLLRRVSYIFAEFKGLSRITMRSYGVLRRIFGTQFFPEHNTIPLVGIDILHWAEKELPKAQPGDAFIVHTITPHFPFSFDKLCKQNHALTRRPKESTYEYKYRLYIAQLQCVHMRVLKLIAALKKAGIWEKVTLIVHGDHGSRVSRENLMYVANSPEKIHPQSYMDHFSTLFAYKTPRSPKAKVHRSLRPIYSLLKPIVQEGKVSSPQKSYTPATIYLHPVGHKPQKISIPPMFRQATTKPKATNQTP